MSVERFEPEQGCYNCEGGKMWQYAEGEYVRYADYAALTAELEALRRDAERYRWLRNDPPSSLAVRADRRNRMNNVYLDGYELDAAIDAARQQEAANANG